MSYEKDYYVGSYLEVVLEDCGCDFDTDMMDQRLRTLNGSCSTPKDNKYFFIPNNDCKGFGFLQGDNDNDFSIEISAKLITEYISFFKEVHEDEIEDIITFYGNGSVKFGFITGGS